MQQVAKQIRDVVSNLSNGQHKKQCPECQNDRSGKNQKDRPLSIRIDTIGVKYRCHHCAVEGGWDHDNNFDFDLFVAPPPLKGENFPLSIDRGSTNGTAFDYLKSRHITDEIIKSHVILGTYRFNGKVVPAVGFPYRSGSVVNAVKWRSADEEKRFSQENICEDFFNLDSYVDGNDVLICEGELDALAWMSTDLPDNLTILSVPNGAPAKVRDGKIDPKDDNKFRYIWRAKRQLDSAPRIILNTDLDEPGKALQEEIIRRVGSTKIWTIDLGDYKDASEAVAAKGSAYLEQQFEYCERVPTIGLYGAEAFVDSFVDLYDNGQMKGASTGLASLDRYIQIPPGMLTVVTGFPSSGKSDLVDQICINLARSYNWKTVYCSFEKPPELHMAQLAQKIIDRPFFDGPSTRMSTEERDFAAEWIKENFMFMDSRRDGPNDIDGILSVASAAVMRMGCRVLVIDPYNHIKLAHGYRETDAISDMLTKVQQFARDHECHVFFIAHPTKLPPDRRGDKKVVVTGHDIAGSAAWFAKADIGITAWRHQRDEEPPECHIWKIRWSWIGKHGVCPLHFDAITGRWRDFSPAYDDYDWDFE